MNVTPDLWDLTGPRALAMAALRDCQQQTSVVLVLPDKRHSTDDYEEWLYRLSLEWGAPLMLAGSGDLVDDVLDLWGASGSLGKGEGALRHLVQLQQMQGRRLIATSWHHDLDEWIRRWPTLLKSAGHPEGTRPTSLLAVRACDIADLDDSLAGTDQWGFKIHWFWGAITRLDTEMCVALHPNCANMSALEKALLVEAAAWDLTLASQLAESWNGSADSLADSLRSGAFSTPVSSVSEELARRSVERPPTASREGWHMGEVDQWEDRTYERRPMNVDDVGQVYWRAQLRVIFPRLERYRGQIEAAVRRQASPTATMQLDAIQESSGVLEFGHLLHVVRKYGIKLKQQEFRCLEAARQARNSLAHLEPVEPVTLTQLRGVLGLQNT